VEKKQDVSKTLEERTYNFSIKVIKFLGLKEMNKYNRIYSPITAQLLRASTSIGANIAEAKSASSKKDFIKYYQIALKSANETKYWIGLIQNGLKINNTEIEEIERELSEITKIIASCVLTMKSKTEDKNF